VSARPPCGCSVAVPILVAMRTYLTIICLLWTVPAYAVDTLTVAPQPEPLSESWRWTEFDLPGAVRDIFEDRDGNVWFATDVGAVRYDGKQFRTFTTEDGLGADNVRAVTQTKDGALWFGTYGGGITRMLANSVRTYTVEDGLASNAIAHWSLAPSKDGGLWAGFTTRGGIYAGGLSHFDGRAWSVVETPSDTLRVLSLTEAADGAVWIASFGQGLLRLQRGEWTVFGPEQGLPGLLYFEIVQTSDGSVWATSWDESAISRFRDGHWTVYRPADGLTDAKHLSIWETPDRRILSSNTLGDIVTFTGESWHPVETARSPTATLGTYSTSSRDVQWIYGWGNSSAYRIRLDENLCHRFDVGRVLGMGHQTPDGSTWFVTHDGPVSYDGQNWKLYGPPDGLLDPPYERVAGTDDGSVWFYASQSRGLCRYVKGRWEVHKASDIGLDGISLAGEFGDGNHTLIRRQADGTFWVAGSKDGKAAASRYDGQSWQILDPGVDAKRFWKIFEAKDGDLWFSGPSRGGGGALRFDGTSWTRYTTDDGLLHNRIWGFGQTPDGTLWAGTYNGISWFTGTTWESYEAGFPGRNAYKFVVSGSDLWCSYGGPGGGSGVSRYRSEWGTGKAAWRTYGPEDGLAGDFSRDVLADPDGTVWVATSGGISHFDPGTELWGSYTEEHGIWPGYIEHLWLDPDGRLNYTTQTGLTGSLKRDRDAPETVFGIAPDEVGSSGNIQLTWSGRDLWDITPPEKVRYQHRLDEGDWSPWGSRTDITLTSLSSGEHRIEVRSVDTELNVEAAPVVHAFVVEAPWWRNPVVAGPGLLLIIAVLFQSARVVRGKQRLEAANEALSSANNELFQVNRDLESVNVDLQREQVLERLRGQAQGMQTSGDIGPVVETIQRELAGLGISLIFSSIAIYRSESELERWFTGPDGRLAEPVTHQLAQERIEARKRGEPYHHKKFEDYRQQIRQAVDAGQSLSGYDWRVVPEERWPNRMDMYSVFFEGGHVSLVCEEPVSEDILTMVSRFGDVFGFAHSRYKELQEKEGQNRRLAVEASVQRLRAEVQSMDEASDFERILSLLTDSLKTVELTFDGCEIDVLDEPVENPTMAHFEANGFRCTTFMMDPQGAVTAKSYNTPAPFLSVIERTIERFIAGEPWQGLSDDLRIVEVPAGSYGRLRLTATDRDPFTEDEVATLREFADAVALGYARYLDIREIQEATVRKSAFLASMSHELRTPMNAIKGFTNLVLGREKNLSERGQENLQKVDRASDHLLTMLNDLLDLSKIEAGRMDVNATTFNVKDLITSSCDTVSPLVQEGVELKQDVADGEANTDKARVQQMVINLLSNAIKFTNSGSVTVKAEQSDGQLVISVTDTGKGIPAEELPTLFDEYRQVEGSESSVQKGTGLGLSITKKFAELLGGSIGVESEIGKGSTFTVRVPVKYQE